MQQKKPWDDFIEWISNLFNPGNAGVPNWIWFIFLMVLIALLRRCTYFGDEFSR
jgi:hypothetical protein